MKFDLIQTRKELFDADFVIQRLGIQEGFVEIRDWSIARTGIIRGEFAGREFMLRRNANIVRILTPHDPKNEYVIFIDGIAAGSVCHNLCKSGLFHSFTFDRMTLSGNEYYRYGIGLGRKGNCSPIYRGDLQIAQFSIEPEIINDCFHYRCSALGQDGGFVALLFCCYSYITVGYKPGEKRTHSIRKTYSMTTNKEELKYYDPGFEGRVDI